MFARVFLVVVSMLFTFGAPALAQRAREGETLDGMLPRIRAEYPGQLSNASLWIDPNGHRHYRIKWVTPEGRILYFDFDASSGNYSEAGRDEGGQ